MPSPELEDTRPSANTDAHKLPGRAIQFKYLARLPDQALWYMKDKQIGPPGL